MYLKYFITGLALTYFVICNAQNVFIKGEVKNYSPNYVPFSVRNFKSNNNSNIAVNLIQNKSFETTTEIEKGTIFTLFYKTIFLEPNDTINFNFSFLKNDPKNYENSISVVAKYPGNLLYYDFLERLLLKVPKLTNSDSTNLLNYYDSLKNYIYSDVRIQLDSFVQNNNISPAFKSLISKEFDFYFLCELLITIQYNTESITKSLRIIIDKDIQKAAINDKDLESSLYYIRFLGSYVESYIKPKNLYLSNPDYYKSSIEKLDKTFIGLNKDLAFAACTRLHYISKPNIYNEVSDSIKNFVLTNIENTETKLALITFLSSYTGISDSSFQNIIVTNTKNKKFILKETFDKKHTVTLVDFWASWCTPCIKEYSFLKNLLLIKPNIEIISISIDFDKIAWLNKINDLNLKKQNHYLIFNNEESEKLKQIVKLENIPRFMLLNKKGKIIFSHAARLENINDLVSEIELLENLDNVK